MAAQNKKQVTILLYDDDDEEEEEEEEDLPNAGCVAVGGCRIAAQSHILCGTQIQPGCRIFDSS